MSDSPRRDLYQVITDRIVRDLETGVAPWHKPWTASAADLVSDPMALPRRSTGETYRGINVVNLWCARMSRGFESCYWMTFNQARDLGGSVRKGARSELVVFAKQFVPAAERARVAETGEDPRYASMLRHSCVFNVCEIADLPARFYAPAPVPVPQADRNAAADLFAGNTGAVIRHGGGRAFYAPATDHIQMPHIGQFKAPADYYGTLLHELAHWTKHESRLARDTGRKRWGDAGYAIEEMVAEMAAAFLCADLGVSAEPRPDHAQYIASWLAVLKSDNTAVVKASGMAQRAADYLHGLQGEVAAPADLAEAA